MLSVELKRAAATVGAAAVIAALSVVPAELISAKPQADHAINSKGTGASGRAATFVATGSYSDGSTRVLKVRTDSDNDGKMEEGELRVTCTGGQPVTATYSTRDAGSAVATGRRQARPFEAVPAGTVYRGIWDSRSQVWTVTLDAGSTVCRSSG